jgi:hypothetical protein
VRWLDLRADFNALLEYQKRDALGLREYLASLRGVRSFAVFALDDMKPFFKAYRNGLYVIEACRLWRQARTGSRGDR